MTEFRDMVKALHRAGIEVILDVVFNHTSEGNHQGQPSTSRVGQFNLLPHVASDRQYYMDYSGCGNTPQLQSSGTEKLIVECLEYWVREMHVDGFRFDEGSILARGQSGEVMAYPPVIWTSSSPRPGRHQGDAEAWMPGLPDRYFPVSAGRMERALSRRCAAVSAGRRGMVGAVAMRIAAHRISTRHRAPSDQQHQLHHLS